MKVKFINIGGAQVCFEVITHSEVTLDFIIRHVRPHCITFNLSAFLRRDGFTGVIMGGTNTIGEFAIVDEIQ
jgi:hypothetical protein